MPRLTADGRVSFGYGRYWFDPARTILQDCSSGVCKIVLSDGTLISERGNSQHVEGRNSLWVAQDAAGVYGSFGDISGAAIASGPSPVAAELIGPDNSLIFKRSYQSAGPWFNTATGQEIAGDGDSWQNLGGGRWIARRGMEIQDETGHVLGRGWWPRWKDGHFLYQAEDGPLVLDGHVIGPSGNYFRPDFNVSDPFFVVWSPTEGEDTVLSRELTAAELAACPLYAAPAPPRPIGPVSAPRPADGRSYDLLAYLLGHPGTWPRVGPTHPMHQVQSGDLFHFVKFGNIVPNGEAYETWGADANWIYHLEDASAEPYHFSDPRWFPRHMEIGEAHGFDTGSHEIVFTRRYACNVWRRDPVGRRMWVEAVYDKWYWGPDLGERETMVIAYDPTGGFHIPGRNVELGYYALGAGSCRWESYHSELVYPPGARTAQFTPSAMEARSDFYLLGGPVVWPKLTGCVRQVCPHWPPWQVEPEPEPEPYQDINGVTMQTERGWLIGPGDKVLSMDAAGKVTFDRTDLTDADLVELAPIDGDRRGTLRPVAHMDRYLTADSTQFAPGGNACLAYYGAAAADALGPDGKPGWYQRWDVGVWPSGLVTALVPYIEQGANHGRHFGSPALTWVRQA